MFSIDCQTGVKIQHLSAYTSEAEVLLAGGTKFRVANKMVSGDVTIINLKEVSSGLNVSKCTEFVHLFNESGACLKMQWCVTVGVSPK